MAKKETVQAQAEMPVLTNGGYTEEQIKRINLEGEKTALEAALARSSECGDWKISKFLETVLASNEFWDLFNKLDLPYTRGQIERYVKARKEKRARISEIEAELAKA